MLVVLAGDGVDARRVAVRERDRHRARADQLLSYCFLDDDPVATAGRLRPVLAARWRHADAEPLLAAPFYAVVPYQWDRYVP